jgi:outer membrane protein insertion porin family
MKPVSRRWLRFCAVLVACLQWAAVAQQVPLPIVEDIKIEHAGPAAVSDDLVRANIRLQKGKPYNRQGVDDDIRNLYGTGYFYNIRVIEDTTKFQTTPDGLSVPAQVILTYRVQAKPIITEIRFSGNKKYSTTKLRRKLTSKTGEPLDELKLFHDTEEIKKMYQKAGMQRTTITNIPSITESLGKGTVTFQITEAPKIRIVNVVFDEAAAFKQRKLRRAIKTRRWWWFSWITGSGKFKDDQFDEDKEKLRDFYTEKGYMDFDIKEIRFDAPKTNRMVIHIDVAEGTQYHVGGVELKGNELFKTDEILQNLYSKDGEKYKKGLLLKPGTVYSPSKLYKDVESLEDFYGARGYVDARAQPERVANIEKGTLDLRYNIREGDKFYVEKVEIHGNTKTRDKVIRRELAIVPGETFNTVKVKVSKSRLEQMQYFEKVETRNEPTEVANRRNLVIDVAEKNTGNIAVGAGFSSVDSVVGFVEVSQGNFDLFNPPYFTGGGEKARIRAQVGTQRQDYIATFVEPWFLGKKLEFSAEVYWRDLNYLSDNYNQKQIGMQLGLRRQLPFNLIAGINYTIETIGIHFTDSYKATYPNSPILLEEGNRLVSKVGASLAYDTRNSYLLPTGGQRIEILGELAGGPFGGETDFYKLEFHASQFWNPGRLVSESSVARDVLEGHVLELGARVGVVENYGSSTRVPLFDRWFLGGLYSLRGYKFRQVGPRDFLSNEPLGGDTYWFSYAEYSIPIIERLRFALFYDVGMVYPDAFSFNPTNGKLDAAGNPLIRGDTGVYNDDWGIGLRLNLPIGPLRLDYGIPITHDPNSGSGGKFQFGVGWTRDF